jgi:hypothetical protein
VVFYGKVANLIDRVLGENPLTVSPEEDDEVRNGNPRSVPLMTFPQAEKLHAAVQTVLDGTPAAYADPTMATNADIAINTLEKEVARIRAMIGEAQSKDRLLKQIAQLIESELRVKRNLEEWERELADILTSDEPSIAPVGPVFLAKGETKRIKHAIAWRQFKGDDLNVKVAVTDDAGVIAPKDLKLNFEKHQFDFTYELRGGSKDGEYTVTLTPEVGKKVEVKVTVK